MIFVFNSERFLLKGTSRKFIFTANGCNLHRRRCQAKMCPRNSLAIPAAILTLRLAGEDFARSRDKSNF